MPHPSDEAAAEAAGNPAMLTARRDALTGVFKLLVQQHKHIASLFEDLDNSPDGARRRQLWAEIRRQLLAHDRAEELELYPALEGYELTRDIIEKHRQGAAELEAAIGELELIDVGSNKWLPRLRDVVALVEEHVDDEETDFFPQAQQVLGEAVAAELEERCLGAQRQVLETLA
jgi:hemerythrin superfamily protein